MSIEYYIAGFEWDQGSNTFPNARCEAMSYWAASGAQSSLFLANTPVYEGAAAIGFNIAETAPGTTAVYTVSELFSGGLGIYTGGTFRYIIPGSMIKRSASKIRVGFGPALTEGVFTPFYRIMEIWGGHVSSGLNFDGNQKLITKSGSMVHTVWNHYTDVYGGSHFSDVITIEVRSGQPFMFSAYVLGGPIYNTARGGINSLGYGTYYRSGSQWVGMTEVESFYSDRPYGRQVLIAWISDNEFYGDNYIYHASAINTVFPGSEYLLEMRMFPMINGRYSVSLEYPASGTTIFNDTVQLGIGAWNLYRKTFTSSIALNSLRLTVKYAGTRPPDTLFIDDIYLGVNRAHRGIGVIQIYPEWDYKAEVVQNRADHRTAGGKLYSYKWGSYKKFSIPLEYVQNSKAAVINSWWASDALIHFKIYSGGVWETNTCHMMNDDAPFQQRQKPYTNYMKGNLELETF